jgi:FKBP12-rapamycin complex-associated protein
LPSDSPEIEFLEFRRQYDPGRPSPEAPTEEEEADILKKQNQFIKRNAGGQYSEFLADWLLTASQDRFEKQQRVLLLQSSVRFLKSLDADKSFKAHTSLLWSFATFRLFQEDHKKRIFLVNSLNTALQYLCRERMDSTLLCVSHVLRILFDFCDTANVKNQAVHSVFTSFIERIDSQLWLFFVPQIIARFGTDNVHLKSVITNLIQVTGFRHPFPILFPLLPPRASQTRKREADSVFEFLRPKLSDNLAGLTEQFAAALRDVAFTLWEELERREGEFAPMQVPRLQELCALVRKISQRGEHSFYELSFLANWEDKLRRAENWLQKGTDTCKDVFRLRAVSLFQEMNERIAEAKKQWTRSDGNGKVTTVLDLHLASPWLYRMRDSKMAVPATYSPGQPLVTIRAIDPSVVILGSLTKPRKIRILGSNGISYTFLLKYREDIRRDERVLQFFQFLSMTLRTTASRFAQRMTLLTYPAVPLSFEHGLMGWLEKCEPLMALIRSVQERFQLRPEEQVFAKLYPGRAMPSTGDDFERLRKAYLAAVKFGRGDHLERALLMGSADSGDWLQKRINYTASLASTSFAGYVLGLNDRHLNNIILNLGTGKLAHIDFGDAFDVNLRRDAWPEKVPFRMTRVLVNALDATGVDGTFKTMAMDVMQLMRDRKDEIIGLLRTFVEDPLAQTGKVKATPQDDLARIQWKLDAKDGEMEMAMESQYDMTVELQIDKLVGQATDTDNLYLMFPGWQPYL